MALKLRLTEIAERDIRDIFEFVSLDKELAASRLISRIQERIRSLTHHPFIGPPLASPHRPGVRKYSVPPYLVFYRVNDAELLVLRVLHGSRDIGNDVIPNA